MAKANAKKVVKRRRERKKELLHANEISLRKSGVNLTTRRCRRCGLHGRRITAEGQELAHNIAALTVIGHGAPFAVHTPYGQGSAGRDPVEDLRAGSHAL